MDHTKLEEIIEKQKAAGKKPFFISASAGTTVMGAFDKFEEIGKIAKKHNIWFHIDGCWGGVAIFSSKIKHLVKGVELSDSFAVDPHKGLGVPIFNTFLMVNNHQGLLE